MLAVHTTKHQHTTKLMIPLFSRSTLSALTTSLAFLISASALPAADTVNPSGTWTWSFTTQNGDTINSSLKLKQDAGKLTGTVTGRNGTETQIQNAKLTGDALSFQVVRERNGNTFTTSYHGKISGDTIKGQMEFERNGETRTRDWEAKRKGGDVTGSWKYSFTTSGGQTLEPTLKLKQEGDKVTGVVVFGDNERAISDGKVANGEVTFKVVTEQNGDTFTTKYAGKVEGDSFKGKVNSNWGGTDRTYDLDAKRVKE
jgi:hypothetical protein